MNPHDKVSFSVNPAIEGALDAIGANKRRYVAYLEGETGMDWDFHQGPLARTDEAVFSVSNEWGDEIRFSLKASGNGFDAVASFNPSRTMRRLALLSSDLADPRKMFGWLLDSLPHSKQASLARVASIVARKLYASLPRGLRLINLFVKLADSNASLNTFARIVYLEFLKKGVEGMPPINGKPVEEAVPNPQAPDALKHIPSNYGTNFGRKAYGLLFQMGISPADMSDLLQDFLVEFFQKSPVQEGRALHEAEHYTLKGLRMFAMTRRRSIKRHRQHEAPTLVKDDGGEGDVVREIKDDGIFDAVNNMVSADYMNRMVKFLDDKLKGRVGEGVVPRYFELSLEEGVDDKQIIQNKMLPLRQYNSRGGWHNFKMDFLYPAALEYFVANPPTDDFKQRLDRYLAR